MRTAHQSAHTPHIRFAGTGDIPSPVARTIPARQVGAKRLSRHEPIIGQIVGSQPRPPSGGYGLACVILCCCVHDPRGMLCYRPRNISTLLKPPMCKGAFFDLSYQPNSCLYPYRDISAPDPCPILPFLATTGVRSSGLLGSAL